MKDENKPTINDRVVIYLSDNKTYSVRNTEMDCTIESGIKTPDEALAIKKAYIYGFIDGKEEAKNELNQK